MPKVYGYIYKITNTENNRVYIGQTNRSFKKRYRGNSIHHVYKHSHNKDLKLDIEKYNDDKYWIIEEEFDIAYSAEELNEKECSLFMQYVWDNMPHKKREDLHRLGNYDDDNEHTWYSWETKLPSILYNKIKPSHKKIGDRTKRYIYTTDKIPIVFTSQVKMKNYVEAASETFYEKGRFPYMGYFDGKSGCFYIHWKSKWRLSDKGTIPKVKNISRCFIYRYAYYIKPLYSDIDIYKELVRYTGKECTVREIYKPCRVIRIKRFEVIK
ncbi:hypothetical protein ACQQ2T_07725 [Paraclostridium tenue]